MSHARLLMTAATAVLVAVALTGAAPVQARAVEADYTITVDPRAKGPAISDDMYGVFFEDINYAADGGLYAELVRNRSFEFLPADNGSYNGLTAWTPTADSGGSGSATTVNDDARLNERNRTYLKLDLTGVAGGRYGVTNAGYNTGFAVKAGARYDFSVWARSDNPTGTALTVGLTGAAARTLIVRGDKWRKYSVSLSSGRTVDDGRLSVLAAGGGTLRLDEVSLFPRDTFKGRANGLRKDLAQKVAALNPGFVRFPGGCLVNTGSMYGYDAASGFPRSRSYQWKDTIGPVETRATNSNFWGYNQSYGLGYYEYFQFAEDVGAMPLPVVPALVTGCGQNRATDDPALLRRHIQDTLDLIEFANGPVTSTWGRVRAKMGHPRPFGLTSIAVGNEENLPDAYWANFVQFRAAIEAAHPGFTVISNSGPDDQGTTFDNLWAKNRAAGVAMVDEHYYNSPSWFLQNNNRYDTYARSGPKVFLGEYASQDAKLFNSLSEAAYMTGLERNADVVKMASYAPLFANIDNVQWRPDMIWFDNDESWGSTSYQMQKLFMNNVGDRVVPSTATGAVVQPQPITGAIGLSTWATSARYDDVRVTRPDGTVLYSDDFNDGDADGWTPVQPRGSWSVVDGAYVQSDTSAQDTMVKAATIGETDYDLSVTATKFAGAEGFLVAFGVQETGQFYWWNLGGWNNTQGAVEKGFTSAKEQLLTKPNSVTTGTPYDLRIEVRGTHVRLVLNGEEWGSFDDDKVTEPFAQVVTRDDRTRELIVKVVNAQDTAAITKVDLGGLRVAPVGEQTVITGDPGEQNTRTAEPIQPVTSTVRGLGSTFTRTFPPNSVTFLRLSLR
ncbi:alpha-L-arabinofuranosidase C-terminal domain-containing protein [Winogradskya humida]|uniref:non-reducing end alpha-L-arabinofuranosidase n=1 Tax=Winogradskya humida TaxID=113566 RepID=A0ABQ3ZXV3_9ACTN|nr:alpha-L-arabinofuranosidase C-terminal domain-containing protein [Actinoplanes humidus]GIE23388.1 alpha-N-arabinofuranosidase [Actinoplanes humidus]